MSVALYTHFTSPHHVPYVMDYALQITLLADTTYPNVKILQRAVINITAKDVTSKTVSYSSVSRYRCSAGFLGDLPFPLLLHSGAGPYSLQTLSSALNTSLMMECHRISVEWAEPTWDERFPCIYWPSRSPDLNPMRLFTCGHVSRTQHLSQTSQCFASMWNNAASTSVACLRLQVSLRASMSRLTRYAEIPGTPYRNHGTPPHPRPRGKLPETKGRMVYSNGGGCICACAPSPRYPRSQWPANERVEMAPVYVDANCGRLISFPYCLLRCVRPRQLWMSPWPFPHPLGQSGREPGSIPGVGIVPDDAVDGQVFSGISRSFPRSVAVPYSPDFTLVGSQDLDVKAAQISPLEEQPLDGTRPA
ncbi:hypothetical protein PR048_032543 [Dryococelus australis]|uniref:Uncharacterized protein n=1 Tax=Dryococelus australis TaxID=614101 RepID=A0ABQ9G5G9_9NEOP|nr:hypothetical protein PR048_032543 [Dryococelus australis]